jgi:hypothetical protein
MTLRLDLRYALPIAAIGVVLLVIIGVEVCGTDDTPNPDNVVVVDETAEVGPTFTPGPSPTPGAETATPEEAEQPPATVPPEAPQDPAERDAVREQDLAAIGTALAEFEADNDEFPNTNGGIQSLCVYEDADVGCELREFLDPLPADPLGDPGRNGYFYRSDGETYTVFAQKEADALAECDEHPEHLSGFDNVYCIKGP